MKKMLQFFTVSFLLIISTSYSQEKSFIDYLIQKELNPSTYLEAKKIAIDQGLPVSLKFPDGTLIDVLKEENGTLLYSIVKNLYHPFADGDVLTYGEVVLQYNIKNAEVNWGHTSEINYQVDGMATEFLLVADWTNDNVLSLDPVTGDILNANFIPPSPGLLASPKHALLHPAGFITVSDQITDLVQKFDSSGNYLGSFAPAGGVNTAILDNIRGHNYRSNGNLVVAVGSSGNQNSIAEFDNAGNYLGSYIAAGSGGLNSPFCILFRDNDVLVTGSSSDAAHRYDLNGNYLSDLISGINFPQQIIELSNGNLAVAVFSTPSGLGIYDSTGAQINYFTQLTGLRGVFQLPGGNYLVTNGTGLHEMDGTGNFIRTIFSSANMQYISYIDYSVIPVELMAFSAELSGSSVVLNWITATETNNSGFHIERSSNNIDFESIGFIAGFGTTTEPKYYSFNDNTELKETFYYRLKQVDYDGSFSYSQVVQVAPEIPIEFSLSQNYPNPFNPETKIKYTLPFESNVKIKIYNSLGEELRELVNEVNDAGTYEIKFVANENSSGIYFYSIEVRSIINEESFSEVRKMILLK